MRIRTYLLGTIGLLVLISASVIWWSYENRPVALPEPPLKELAAQHNMRIGNFAIRNYLANDHYTSILTSQFDTALIDNTPNWYFTDGGLRPSRDSYNFTQMDEVLRFTEANNMRAEAHHFVWGEEKWLPDWLKNGNYTPDEATLIMQEHIQAVGSRYSGRIAQWTVVNEAFSRGQHIYGLRDWWADHAGGQAYIDQAFIAARAADPHAALLLNDFGNESLTSISNAMYDYIKDAKTRGIPIDGIGMQMHIDGTHPPTKDEVITNMRRFGDLGVKVYVTEFDVNMNDVPAEPSAKDAIQANIYYDMARACIESGVCVSFSILGITDSETWYSYMGLPDARPLPFDAQYRPKPAFYRLREAFEQP